MFMFECIVGLIAVYAKAAAAPACSIQYTNKYTVGSLLDTRHSISILVKRYRSTSCLPAEDGRALVMVLFHLLDGTIHSLGNCQLSYIETLTPATTPVVPAGTIDHSSFVLDSSIPRRARGRKIHSPRLVTISMEDDIHVSSRASLHSNRGGCRLRGSPGLSLSLDCEPRFAYEHRHLLHV